MEGVFRPTLNLGNSMIGVGILAMPYCIQKCGLVLGMLLIASSAMFTIWSLKMLVRAAHTSHKASYEQLAYHAFGRYGKLVIEVSIIGLMIGCLIAYFVVIGDVTPPIVAQLLGVTWSLNSLRMFLMIFLTFTVSLPLSLLRNLDSLSAVTMGSLFFYFCLLIRVIFMFFSTLSNGTMWSSVTLFRFDGLLHTLPICALALSCHPQMFCIYVQMADPSVRKMSTVVSGAICMVATSYGIMAFFGYLNFAEDGVKGDVLTNFPQDGVSQMFRFGFSLSVVVSFPLVMFPLRASIYSLLFSKSSGMELHGTEPIPQRQFTLITLSIILGTLTIAILVPNIESVLALTGATTGSIVGYIFPSLIFLSVVGSNAGFSNRAKFLLVLGFVVMLVGTFTIVSDKLYPLDDPVPRTKTHKYPRPFVAPQQVPEVAGPPIPENFKLPPIGPPLPGDVIGNDVISDDVIQKEGVPIPGQVLFDGGVKNEGVREGGDGDGERREDEEVRGRGGDGGEHESIKKDMEELRERIKAVEEENQELKDVLEKKQLGEEQGKVGDTDNQGAVLGEDVVPPAALMADREVNQAEIPAHLPPAPVELEGAAGDDGADYERLNLELKKSLYDRQEVDVSDEQLNLDPKKSLEGEVEHLEKQEFGNKEQSELDLKQVLREKEELPDKEAEMVDGRVKRELGNELEMEQVREEVVSNQEVGGEKRETEDAVGVREEMGEDDVVRRARELKTVTAGS